MELEHSTIETNGIKLHVVQAGPKSGIPVVLLHGFPEFWYGWRNQIPALVEAGCRVIVPDQRGYNLSDKPKGVKAYSILTLVGDLIGLIDASVAIKVAVSDPAHTAFWIPAKLCKFHQTTKQAITIHRQGFAFHKCHACV